MRRSGPALLSFFFGAIVYLLVITSAVAQVPPNSPEAPGRGGGRRGPQATAAPAELLTGTAAIGGLAVDSLTGQPLSKVRIAVMMRNNPRQRSGATTGADGMFLVANLPAGEYSINAQRSGYARAFVDGERPLEGGPRVILREGSQVRDLVLKLDPGAVLSGRVTDQDGEPLEGVRVQALRARYQQGRRELNPVSTDATDDRGEYRIYGLASGRYYVQAMRPGGPGQRFFGRPGGPPPAESLVPSEPAYVNTYFPGAINASSAEALVVQPGQERSGLDIGLQMERTVEVRGSVAGLAPGADPRRVILFLAPASSSTVSFLDMNRAAVDAESRFRFRDVQPGSYWLVAASFIADNRLSAMQRVEVGGTEVSGIEITLQPGAPVRGVVKVEQTAGGSAAPPPVALTLEPVLRMQRLSRRLQTAPDANGRFEFPEVPAGVYRLSWTGLTGTWFVSSAQAGQLDLLNQDWQMTPGAAAAPLTVTLRPDGAVVRARAEQSGAPLQNALLSLAPAQPSSRTDRNFRASADETGRVEFAGVPPGDYRLYAWESSDGVLDADPDYLAQFQDRSVTLSLGSGDIVEKQVTAIPASETASR